MPRRREKILNSVVLAALLVSFVSLARAENGVLVGHVPGGAEPAIVMAVVKQCLINRKWKISAADDASVSAALNSDSDATIQISLSNGQLLYEGSAIKTLKAGGPAQPVVKRRGDIPKRWIEYLRRDISVVLATLPEKRS